ncbi:MAG TPA: hypothetical protein VGE47_07045 [Burkholderiaceae bacterium]
MRALLTLLFLLLAGCAGLAPDKRWVPGQSTLTEVQALYGAPTKVWIDSDGGRTLEYSSQPNGQNCWMLHFGPEGRLLSVEDTLRPESRARIALDMNTEQVSRMLGRERSRVFFQQSGEDVWDWTIEPAISGYGQRFNVHFKNGVVVNTSQSMVYPSRFGLGD